MIGLDPDNKMLHAPHVVMLGAGASVAAFPNGDKNGRKVPLMKDLVGVFLGGRWLAFCHFLPNGLRRIALLWRYGY